MDVVFLGSLNVCDIIILIDMYRDVVLGKQQDGREVKRPPLAAALLIFGVKQKKSSSHHF